MSEETSFIEWRQRARRDRRRMDGRSGALAVAGVVAGVALVLAGLALVVYLLV